MQPRFTDGCVKPVNDIRDSVSIAVVIESAASSVQGPGELCGLGLPMELRARMGAAVAVLFIVPALLGATPTPPPGGATATLTPVFTGADAQAMQLQLDDGNTLDAKTTTAAALIAQKITYKELIQAAGVAVELQFLGDTMAKPESLKKPLKLVFPIDPKMESARIPTSRSTPRDPSFRVDLTCDANAKAT